jgi:hypothetical protein
MSIDNDVYVVRIPKDLRTRWQTALAAHGILCSFRPDFDVATWGGSDFITKMQIQPDAFAGAERYGEKPFVTGCGLDLWHAPEFDDAREDLLDGCPQRFQSKLQKATFQFFFYTSAGRTPAQYRFQVYAAATLALVTGGVLYEFKSTRRRPSRW